MSDGTEERLAELQTAVAYLEQTVGELSDVVRQQWTEIDTLKNDIKRLEETKADAADDDVADQAPPHY